MMKGSAVAMVAAWCMVVLVAAQIHGTAAAATCNPAELKPCLPAIMVGTRPTAECCSKLKEQQPCFCRYLKNPALKPFIDNPNTKKLIPACALRLPKCTFLN